MPSEALYDRDLSRLMAEAADGLVNDLDLHAPALAERVVSWMFDLSPGGRIEEYFTYEWAYPIFLLPWWLETSLTDEPDLPFLSDVVRSTMSGYYFIRLLDNLMDGDGTTELEILPATGFFHERFQSAYASHFQPAHSFWEIFRREWFACAEATVIDHGLPAIDRSVFLDVSARKMRAGFIPVAAVCLYNGRPDLLAPWRSYCDLLSRCVQMTDDVFDWHADLTRTSGTTYFLSEGARRRESGESVSAWVVREGFAWGTRVVREWLEELRLLAPACECERALDEAERRLVRLDEREASLRGGHADLARIAAAFAPRT